MQKLLVANWKMYLSDREAAALARAYLREAGSAPCRLAAAPSYTALAAVGEALAGSPVALAAQDVFWEARGAYTGEVGVESLSALGARYVIVGHSERRAIFGETDELIGRKLSAAARGGLVPILCVGETREEREAGARDEVVRRQLAGGLANLPEEAECLIAYEPRWAIGTGTPCDPGEAARVHRMIHAALEETFGATRDASFAVLYGGSVDASNVAGFAAEDAVDGFLVGGASADEKKFIGLLQALRV